MQVRHNTHLLERAVELVVQRAGIPTRAAEAEAAEKQARAVARRRLATGAAVALAAVGLGLGVMLGLWRPEPFGRLAAPEPTRQSLPSGASTARVPTPSSTPAGVSSPDPSLPPGGGPVTVDYTKFARREVALLGKTWVLVAGHHYERDTDPTWERAWCYTSTEAEKISIRIELVERSSPTEQPKALIASPETLAKVGLDDAAALALATKCPWLDEKDFRIDAFRLPPGRDPKFDLEKPVFQLSGRTLVMRGAITADLSRTLARYDFDKLQVSSSGGLVLEAMAAGDSLRRGSKAVEVSGECLSACVLLLAGGASRTATSTARIGVHRFYSAKQDFSPRDIEISQVLSSQIIRYLDRMGIDQALFHAMAAVASNDMAYLDHDTLRRWRLLSPVLAALPPPAEIPPAPRPSGSEAFETRDGFDAMGGDLPSMPLRVELPACEERCRDTDSCAGYTYNKAAKACFLKSRIGPLMSEDVALTGLKPGRVPSPQIARLQIKKRKGLVGDVLSQRVNIYVDCATGCEENGACRGFQHVFENRQCVWFKSISSETDVAGAISGVKGGP